jgi:hypothetical protein
MTVLIPYASLEPVPWKNGGGNTLEIAVGPPGAGLDEFDWRVSLAAITHDGAFSTFPGVERSLALVEGEGALIELDTDTRYLLCPDDPCLSFRGDAVTRAALRGGPINCLNVMTRRGRCQHRIGRRSIDDLSEFAARGEISLLFLAEGDALSVSSDAERIGLVRFDTLMVTPGTLWTLEATQATVLVVDLFVQE